MNSLRPPDVKFLGDGVLDLDQPPSNSLIIECLRQMRREKDANFAYFTPFQRSREIIACSKWKNGNGRDNEESNFMYRTKNPAYRAIASTNQDTQSLV